MSTNMTQRLLARRAGQLPRHVRLLLRMGRRELPAPLCDVAVERGIEVPAGDGVPMLTDHYRPLLAGPRPTLLVRTSYGRGFPWDYVYGGLFARQGFHVVIQSCRGTGGSGGELEPFVNEGADAQAAVAWLREQDWFDGALGTVGASYLGYTQWALATDPPPELLAMAIQVSSEDFHGFLYPGGAFALEATLTATTATISMHRGFGRFLVAMVRLLSHIRRAERTLPFIDAYPAAFGGRVRYFEDWLTHPHKEDPYWAPRRTDVPAGLTPPASLLTGWWDACLDPTLAAYEKLRAAGREVRLVVGPWNHASGFNDDMPVLLGEALSCCAPTWRAIAVRCRGSRSASMSVRSAAAASGASWPTGRRRTCSTSGGTCTATARSPGCPAIRRRCPRSATTRPIPRRRSAARPWTRAPPGRSATTESRRATTCSSSPVRRCRRRSRSSALSASGCPPAAAARISTCSRGCATSTSAAAPGTSAMASSAWRTRATARGVR
jgi:hypothetical protein